MSAISSNDRVTTTFADRLNISDVTQAHVGRTVSIYQDSYYRKLSLTNSRNVRLVGVLEDVRLDNSLGRVLVIDGERYTCPNSRLWETVIVF